MDREHLQGSAGHGAFFDGAVAWAGQPYDARAFQASQAAAKSIRQAIMARRDLM